MERGNRLGLAVIAAAFVVLIGFVVHGSPGPQAWTAPSGVEARLSSVGQTSAAYVPVPIASARTAFENKQRPFVVAVVGDSTGNGTDRWPFVVARWLADRTGRPVEFHPWDVTANRYLPAVTTPGVGAPLVVWNFSATGMNSRYSEAWLAAGVPSSPDLIFINHGHNETASTAGSAVSGLLVELRQRYQKTPAIVIGQNPEVGNGSADQQRRVRDVLAMARLQEAPQIDVYSAFTTTGVPLRSLYLDDRHPNSEGTAIWAATVEKVIGPALGVS